MGRFDDTRPFSPLLFCYLLMELVHFRPVQFGTEMVLRMIPIVKPKRIVNLFVRTDTPRDRFIRVSTEMQEIAVQIG